MKAFRKPTQIFSITRSKSLPFAKYQELPLKPIAYFFTQEKWAICKLNVLKAPTIPPKFPCISNNQGATKKTKREVESVMEGQHYKQEGEKCKKEHENTLISSILFILDINT